MKISKKLRCLFVLLFTFLYVNTIYAANDFLPLGKTVAVTIMGDTYSSEAKWFSINISEDGLYEFSCTTKDSMYSNMTLYNESGDEIVSHYSPAKYNSMNGTANITFQCFLHIGVYNLNINEKGENSVSYKKINTDYQLDREPNNDMQNAIPLQTNKWYSGYVDGRTSNGGFDESDLYVFNAQANTTYKITAEATGRTNIRFLRITENGNSEHLFTYEPKENELENLYRLNNEEITFSKTGKYYVDFAGMYRYNSSFTDYNGYKFMISGNTEITTEIKAPQITNTAIGVKINWQNENNAGYRVYRAEAGQPPIAVSDVVYGNSFVDVNVESNKKYYYIVVPENENIVTEIEENLKTETITETILQPENTGVKNFILMKIGNPNMTVGEKILEIDPGRATVPVIQNGRTLVPIRAIVEAMGGTVDWNETERKVTLNAKNHNVEMWLGKKEFIVDGIKKEMDIAPDTINNRTMLPIRFVTENVGCQIEWIGTTEEVIIVF